MRSYGLACCGYEGVGPRRAPADLGLEAEGRYSVLVALVSFGCSSCFEDNVTLFIRTCRSAGRTLVLALTSLIRSNVVMIERAFVYICSTVYGI